MLSNTDRAKVDAYRILMAQVYELAAVSRRDSESIAAEQGVTVTQWHTMSVLSEGATATVPQVAARLGVTRQAVQRVADHLVDRGLLQRISNPRHDTSPLLQLTPSGDDVLRRLWDHSDGPRARMLADVGTRSMEEAAATLQDLLAALKERGQPRG